MKGTYQSSIVSPEIL